MSDEELVRRLVRFEGKTCVSSDDEVLAAEAIERLTRERDEANLDAERIIELSRANVARAEAAERKVEKLRGLMQTLIDNEPYEPISDAGHTVIDLWRHEVSAALAEMEKQDG